MADHSGAEEALVAQAAEGVDEDVMDIAAIVQNREEDLQAAKIQMEKFARVKSLVRVRHMVTEARDMDGMEEEDLEGLEEGWDGVMVTAMDHIEDHLAHLQCSVVAPAASI